MNNKLKTEEIANDFSLSKRTVQRLISSEGLTALKTVNFDIIIN